MLNPMMDLVRELKKMNEGLNERLDTIINRLDILIEMEMEPKSE